MRVEISTTKTPFGQSYILIAELDQHHSKLVREFYSYADAYSMASLLLAEEPTKDMLSLFKRKGK